MLEIAVIFNENSIIERHAEKNNWVYRWIKDFLEKKFISETIIKIFQRNFISSSVSSNYCFFFSFHLTIEKCNYLWFICGSFLFDSFSESRQADNKGEQQQFSKYTEKIHWDFFQSAQMECKLLPLETILLSDQEQRRWTCSFWIVWIVVPYKGTTRSL